MTLTSFNPKNSVDICMDDIVFNVSSLPPPTHHLIAKDQMTLMIRCIRIQKKTNNNNLINYKI